jgi:hypothetical protein
MSEAQDHIYVKLDRERSVKKVDLRFVSIDVHS